VTTESVAVKETFVVIEQQPPQPPSSSSSSLRHIKSSAAVSKHIPLRSSHQSAGQHACSQCGKRYQSTRYLQTHQLSHGGLKPLLCDTCGRGFYALVNLKRHVLLRHHVGLSHRDTFFYLFISLFTFTGKLEAHEQM